MSGDARYALWRFVVSMDLVTRVHAWNQPVDETLPWLVSEPRRVVRSLRDSLWLRLIDVPGALSTRRYSCADQLVLELKDSFCPWNIGTYKLPGSPEGAECSESSARPDLRLEVGELGAVFLGGNRFQTLARAGLVEGSPEALRRADNLFAWDPAPWCPEVF